MADLEEEDSEEDSDEEGSGDAASEETEPPEWTWYPDHTVAGGGYHQVYSSGTLM